MTKKYIAVDIGGTSIKLGIVTEEGDIIARSESVYTESEGGGTVMDAVKDSIRALLDERGESAEDYCGIGVSAAGCINSVSGSVAGNGGNIPGWANTEVCSILREEFGIPVTIANDANCAVLGEFWKGAADGYMNVLAVTLGTGVGGGIITGGRLLEGAHGYAGELGHFPMHAGDDQCVCGMKGCYERYASTSALVRMALSEDPDLRSGRLIFTAAEGGDLHAQSLLDRWIDNVAYGLAGLIHIFDPELVLIGGGVSSQQSLLIEPLKKKVLSLVMPDFADGIEFKSAALGNDAGMIGAVYYHLSTENISRKM